MDIFAVVKNGRIVQLTEDIHNVISRVETVYQAGVESFLRQPDWTRRHYICASNYAANLMNSTKVYRLESDNLIFPDTWPNLYGRAEVVPGVTDITDTIFTVTDSQYEGNPKVFATVTKTGIKSHGLDVIVDPQLFGENIRPVSEYEALVGTFARVKATTDIAGYGYTVLFFAPESLGNYRVETQMINGKRFSLV